MYATNFKRKPNAGIRNHDLSETSEVSLPNEQKVSSQLGADYVESRLLQTTKITTSP